MPNTPRVLAAAALVLLAACSSQPATPALPDDLKADLARAGGGDVVLAGASLPRLDVVSALERTERSVVTPRAPSVSRAPSARRGTTAVVRSARRVAPAPAPRAAEAEEVAPAEEPRYEPAPEPVQSQRRPEAAPLPSTQREPAGGWSTPGRVIRNAPFPINPLKG